MSIFDYPRINFAGQLRLNPGTANNDDYAQPAPSQNLMPQTFGPRYDGHAMGLLETGSAWVNQHFSLSPFLPFGGVKESGMGVENGHWGLAEFTSSQVLNVRKR